ncbi:hypothetical protein TNCV_3331811 [Trichonephila clavipes]|nr:hypothetical protein TNCV_3331811 [Trichonephila clavipes]
MRLIELKKYCPPEIPSHCNISGNEKADRLAKAGFLMSQPDSLLPLHNIKRLIYNKPQVKGNMHRFGVKDSASCPMRNQTDHLRHYYPYTDYPIVWKFFIDNPMEANFDSFFASSSFYWAALRLMAEMLKMGVG